MINWNYKHWLWNTKFYRTWYNILWRCNRETNRSKYYRDKWIKCKWKNFQEFKDDMYNNYILHTELCWEKNTTIERKDWNLDYCKENCRRATYQEQSITNSKTHYIEYKWKRYNLSELSKSTWIHISNIKNRIYRWIENMDIILSKKKLPKTNSIMKEYTIHCEINKNKAVSYVVFYNRLKRSLWTVEKAINTPSR